MNLKDPSEADVLTHLTEAEITEAVQADDHFAFCIACGTEHQPFEPDAKNEQCVNEDCGELAVFGAEELLFRIVS